MSDKTKNTKSVTLRPAFCWDCDECGRENFARAVVPEFSAEDLQAMRNEHGIEPWEAGDFVTMPPTVTCSHCGVVFSAVPFEDGSEMPFDSDAGNR